MTTNRFRAPSRSAKVPLRESTGSSRNLGSRSTEAHDENGIT